MLYSYVNCLQCDANVTGDSLIYFLCYSGSCVGLVNCFVNDARLVKWRKHGLYRKFGRSSNLFWGMSQIMLDSGNTARLFQYLPKVISSVYFELCHTVITIIPTFPCTCYKCALPEIPIVWNTQAQRRQNKVNVMIHKSFISFWSHLCQTKKRCCGWLEEFNVGVSCHERFHAAL